MHAALTMQLGTHSHLSGSNPKVLLTDWWVPQCFPRRNGKDSVSDGRGRGSGGRGPEGQASGGHDKEVEVRRPYF